MIYQLKKERIYQKSMSKIRSKKNDLFNYFACNHKDLSAQYIKDCETFLINLGNKKKKFKGGYNRSNFFITALKKSNRLQIAINKTQ